MTSLSLTQTDPVLLQGSTGQEEQQSNHSAEGCPYRNRAENQNTASNEQQRRHLHSQCNTQNWFSACLTFWTLHLATSSDFLYLGWIIHPPMASLAGESINVYMFWVSPHTKQTKGKQAGHLQVKMHSLILSWLLWTAAAHLEGLPRASCSLLRQQGATWWKTSGKWTQKWV